MTESSSVDSPRAATLRLESLTVVVPAFNEARRLPQTLARLSGYLRDRVRNAEVLVVDDGSTDDTVATAASLGDAVTVVRQSHAGKGAAVRRGVLAAGRDWILVMDADMAIPIEEIERLADAADDAPIVIGSKRLGNADLRYPLLRRIGSRLGQLWIQLLVVRGFRDTQCGFKLFRRDAAQQLFAVQRLDGFGFDFEVLYLARRYGIAVRELPVSCHHVAGGTVRIRAYVRTFLEALAVVRNRLLGRYPRTPPPPRG